jgi:D-alanyl-D-alanine dipeptidase
LVVINEVKQWKNICSKDPRKKMTDLKRTLPGLRTDLRYATTNNFMHRRLYPRIKTTWLRKPAADSLAMVQKDLEEKGLGLKVFDAYRPYSVTEKMWEPIRDERYVADPKKGSGHNRGVAVDLTIIDLGTKKELDMGTGFDNFSDTAHHSFLQLPQKVLQNRVLLKTVMEKHGFKALESEWWHYSLYNASDFELLDLSFSALKKAKG